MIVAVCHTEFGYYAQGLFDDDAQVDCGEDAIPAAI